MENYEVVLAKTVRDLFRSTSLPQIRKYKQNKEKEILKKEEEIKSLILLKYPLLIKSINSFEQISNHLSDLQEVRKLLAMNIENFRSYRNPEFKENENFDCEKLFEILQEIDIKNEEYEERFQDEIDNCWDLLRQNEFDKLIRILIKINENVKGKEILYSNYELLLIDLMNTLIKNYITLYQTKELDITKFLLNCFTVFYCVKDQNKLIVSEQYFKLQKSDLISGIVNDCFKLSNDGNCLKSTFEFFIKLMILKISKLFSEMNDSDCINIKYDLILNISFLINFYFSLAHYGLLDNLSNNCIDNKKIVFSIDEFIQNLKHLTNNHSLCFYIDSSVKLENNLEHFFKLVKQELVKHIKLDKNVDIILELSKNLINNFSSDEKFSNEEINKILFSFQKSKIIHENTNLILFDIIYYEILSEAIKDSFLEKLKSCSFENYCTNKQSHLNFDSFLIKIFIILEKGIKEGTKISQFFEVYLNIISNILVEFLKNQILLFNSDNIEERKTHLYEYLAFLSNILFNDSLRNCFKRLESNDINNKLEELKILFTDKKKSQIEEEINKNCSSLLKIENYEEISKEDFNLKLTSTFSETIFNLSTKYLSNFNEYDFQISFDILLIFIRFYEEFVKNLSLDIKIYNPNILFDVYYLKFIFQEFQKKSSLNMNFPEEILLIFMDNYKGEIEFNSELLDFEIKFKENEKQVNELLIYEFFFSNEKTNYSKYNSFKKAQKIKTLTKTSNEKPEENRIKDCLIEYLVLSKKMNIILNQSQKTAIEKNRLKNLSSFKLLTLRMEENFLSIKDEGNSKAKIDKNKSGVIQGTLSNKNENSSYLGFINNVIQNNNQSISSFISKFTSFK